MYRKREWSLWGEKVVLVPYSPHHVLKYNGWMQDPILRFQTGSKPLSLEQEYQMQHKWLVDEDKCTFISLDRQAYEKGTSSEVECMVGDVNLFFTDTDDHTIAEIELMIAEPSCRRKGMGVEVAHLMMAFGASELGVKTFRAKIGCENEPSLQLFRSKLSFSEVSHSNIFKEVTLELAVKDDAFAFMDISTKWRTYNYINTS